MDLVVSRHKRSFGNRTAGGNRLPDFGEEALPVRGKVVSGMNKIFYTFVLSALVLLSVQCNPKPQESDEQIGNDSIIEYAELLIGSPLMVRGSYHINLL